MASKVVRGQVRLIRRSRLMKFQLTNHIQLPRLGSNFVRGRQFASQCNCVFATEGYSESKAANKA